MFSGKRILITGATGSLGKALIKKLLPLCSEIICYSRDELKQSEMVKEFPSVKYILGDVRDLPRLTESMVDVDYVIHAAALKQVPTLEYNPMEAIKTNILGSQNVIDACKANKVKKAVLISTDKSCEPRNSYGATKMLAEKLFTSQNCSTIFACVRYGNVIGSRGSVIPLWKKLAEDKKPIQITDPEMTRFWITLEQAVDLVFHALEQNRNGQIYVPKIPSMSMIDLAKTIAPDSTREISGIRPGEKIHEKLVGSDFSNVWMVANGVDYPATGDFTSNGNDLWMTPEQLRQII
jgi:UDP-N-acetylglucosamine 4,6-dehydratase